jgi:spermidine synthase
MALPGDKEFASHSAVEASSPQASKAPPPRFSSFPTPLLTLLFAASGCAALIYEIIWFQMLQLVIGSTAISLAVILASFMGGMCLGSIALPRFVGLTIHPLRLWALLEMGIGVLGIVVLFALPLLAKVYTTTVASGFGGILFRGLICAICLLPPTILMGATLPSISRLAQTTREGASQLGLVYGANTLGAVFGALLAGFFVLRVFDVRTATCIAAGINGTIAIFGLTVQTPACNPKSLDKSTRDDPRQFNTRWPVYVTIALSGFCALGAEVVWTRLLSLILGGTTYTFSIILAVFLLGLGIGSGIGALMARQIPAPGFALGACQVLLAGAIAWAALILAKSLPYWPINQSLSKSVWVGFQLDLVRCLWAILPATCLWGASFPLALAAVAEPGQDPGLLVGRLYAANTLGAILGAVGSSVVLIAWLGTQQTQRLLIALSAVAGLIVLLSSLRSGQVKTAMVKGREGKNVAPKQAAIWLVASGLTMFLAWSVPAVPWPLVAYGRYLPEKTELGTVLYVGEGMNASVAVTELDSGVRNFHVSGKIEASTDQQDMRLQRMLGHIPALFHPEPRSVLVVGCGAGVTAGSFLAHPSIQRITLCEIEPLIPKVVARYFGEENYDVVQDPRVRLIYDDARHYIFTTREKFDVITSDPIHPWVKGAATLYTKEYFELCKQHLNPGGLVTQWVPLYESDLPTVKSEVATFFEVFPDGTLWSNEDLGAGYDLVLLGQVGPLEVDVETLQRRLSRADHAMVLQSLRDVGIRSAFGLAATYAGQSHDLKPWLKYAQINHDRDLRLQYLAGLGLNFKASDSIYAELSSYRRFPEAIFVGSNMWNDALKRALQQPKPNRQNRSKETTGRSNRKSNSDGD